MKSMVSEKGQVTIPKALRDRLGLQAGQVLDFYEESGRLVAVKASAIDAVESVYGVLGELDTQGWIEELRGDDDADSR